MTFISKSHGLWVDSRQGEGLVRPCGYYMYVRKSTTGDPPLPVLGCISDIVYSPQYNTTAVLLYLTPTTPASYLSTPAVAVLW